MATHAPKNGRHLVWLFLSTPFQFFSVPPPFFRLAPRSRLPSSALPTARTTQWTYDLLALAALAALSVLSVHDRRLTGLGRSVILARLNVGISPRLRSHDCIRVVGV